MNANDLECCLVPARQAQRHRERVLSGFRSVQRNEKRSVHDYPPSSQSGGAFMSSSIRFSHSTPRACSVCETLSAAVIQMEVRRRTFTRDVPGSGFDFFIDCLGTDFFVASAA